VASDLSVILEDSPGQLARIGEATGQHGVNVLGMAAFTGDGRGVIHILVDDPAKARKALDEAGIGIADEREALVVDIENQPGSLGELSRRLAEANVNIELAYTTFGDGARIVIVTDDLDAARSVL
jgi:hypothetical protein